MPNNTPAPADLVEAVAHAIIKEDGMWKSYCERPEIWAEYFDQAKAAIAAYQAHMASDGITDMDREAAAHYNLVFPDIRLTDAFAAHRRAAAGKVEEPECQTCHGTAEIFGHAPGCDNDYCALAGGMDDCNGLVEPCPTCTPQPDPRDAEIERLREALTEIANRHIGDQPAADGGTEADWAVRNHTALRAMARTALANSEGK